MRPGFRHHARLSQPAQAREMSTRPPPPWLPHGICGASVLALYTHCRKRELCRETRPRSQCVHECVAAPSQHSKCIPNHHSSRLAPAQRNPSVKGALAAVGKQSANAQQGWSHKVLLIKPAMPTPISAHFLDNANHSSVASRSWPAPDELPRSRLCPYVHADEQHRMARPRHYRWVAPLGF